MGKHGCVTHELVDDIRLRSVKRVLVMSDILGGVEDLEGETVQELTLGEKTSDWLQSPASFGLKELRDIFKLRNLSFAQIDFLLKLCDGPVEFRAGMVLEQTNEVAVTEGPYVFLLLSVLESWDWVSHLVRQGQIGDFFSSCTIDRVTEAGVVSILNTIAFRQNSFSDVIEIINVNWEPRDGLGANLGKSHSNSFKLIHGFLHIFLLKVTMEVNVEVDHLFVACGLGRAGLDASHIDVVISQDLKSVVEGTFTIRKREQNTTAVLHVPKLDCVVGVALASHDVCKISHSHHSTKLCLLDRHDEFALVSHSLEGSSLKWSKVEHFD